MIETHPTEPAHNSPNQGACGGDPTTQLQKRKPTEERNYSSTIIIQKRRHAVQSPLRQRMQGDLITINKSNKDIECLKDPVNDWALQQCQAGNRDPRFTSASRAERRQMMKEGMWSSMKPIKYHHSQSPRTATITPKGTRQSGYKRQYVWAVINHRVTNTSNHHQLGAKVLNAQIQTPLMTTVMENAD